MDVKRFLIILCILEAIVIGCLIGSIKNPDPPPELNPIEIIRDSIIRDSIFIEIEKIKKEYIYISEEYKKDSIDIMSANDSMLFDSFSRYIENYNNK